MTDTAVQPIAADVDQWLSRFDDALTEGDAAAAAELFADDGYWRDLVAFTWNIKTVEGPAGVADMLERTLGHAKPRGLRTTEPPAEADGVTEAWIEFETEVGRGYGHLRLRDGKAWTLLTTLDELKGHEEPRGSERPHGRRARRRPRPARPGSRRASARRRSSGYDDAALRRDRRRRPGRHRARRAAAPARRADDHRRAQRAPRRLAGASATSRSACTTRSGTTTCPTSRSRRTGRSSRRRTRSATGSRCTRR